VSVSDFTTTTSLLIVCVSTVSAGWYRMWMYMEWDGVEWGGYPPSLQCAVDRDPEGM